MLQLVVGLVVLNLALSHVTLATSNSEEGNGTSIFFYTPLPIRNSQSLLDYAFSEYTTSSSNPQFHSSFIVPIHQEDKLVGGLLEREIIVPIIQRDRMVGKPQQTYEIVVPHFENKNIAGGFSQQQYKVPVVVSGPYESFENKNIDGGTSQQQYKGSSPYGNFEKKNIDGGTSQQQHKVPVSGPYESFENKNIDGGTSQQQYKDNSAYGNFENKNIAGGSSQQQYKVPIVVSGPHELVIPYNNYIRGTQNPKEVVPIHEENQSLEQTSPGDYEFERDEQYLWSINNDRYKYPLQEYKAKEPPKKFESLKEYKAKEPPKKFESLKKQEEYIAGKNHSNKIVGGHGASITDYPYQLSLVLWRRFHFCGAVLISEKWALTAAHCTYGRAPYDLAVRAGSSTYASGGELVPLVYIVEHENYFKESTDYDISLLELFRPITHKDAKPISLIMTKPKPGDEAVVTGWGRTLDGTRKPPAILQAVKVPVIDQQSCQKAYSKSKNEGYKITDRMFCAGLLNEGGKDSCQGDSGGPIAVNGMLAGLVSWGFGCGEPNYPGVYTSIADLRDWVEDTLFDNYSY